MLELLKEQLKEYQEKYDKIEKESIALMKQNKPWEHLAKKGAGLKLMIDHCKNKIDKLIESKI